MNTTRQRNRTRTINALVVLGMILGALFMIFSMIIEDDERWAKAEALFQYQQCLADGGTWVQHTDTGAVECDKGDRYGFKE